MRILGPHLIALLIIGAIVGAVSIVRLHRMSRGGRSDAARRVALVLLVGWLAAAAYITLSGLGQPAGVPRSYVNLTPLASFRTASPRQPTEVIGNVALFMPLGALLPFVVRRRGLLVVLASGLALSTSVECWQYALNAGRSADIDDVLLNTCGAVMGWACWAGSRRWFPRRAEGGEQGARRTESVVPADHCLPGRS